MKKLLKITTVSILSACFLYIGAFYLLGWLAPKNDGINQFYSEHFYKLREWKERDYLRQVERYEGKFTYYPDGMAGITYEENKGVSFLIPESLRAQTESISNGVEVSANIGLALDPTSIGIYHNELRNISTLGK